MANSNRISTYLGAGALSARPVSPSVPEIGFYYYTDGGGGLGLWTGAAWLETIPVATLTFGTHLTSGGASFNGGSAVTISCDATNANTASTIVSRDASGNFSAGTITASLSGTVNGNTITTGTGTLTLAASSTLATSGAFDLTLTSTATTNATIPARTHTLAGIDVAQTWSAVQTFTNSDIALLGSSTGKTTFTSDNSGVTDYTLHFPAANATLATTDDVQKRPLRTVTYSSSSTDRTLSMADANGIVFFDTSGGDIVCKAPLSLVTSGYGIETTVLMSVGGGVVDFVTDFANPVTTRFGGLVNVNNDGNGTGGKIVLTASAAKFVGNA